VLELICDHLKEKKLCVWGLVEVLAPQKEFGTANYKTTKKKPANHKKLGPQITNPQSATFAESR
jgi:hypothetical protein